MNKADSKQRDDLLNSDFARILSNPAWRKKLLQEASIDELIALIRWFESPPEGKKEQECRFRLARLARERKQYFEAGVPEEEWPPLLRGENWAEVVWWNLSGEQALPDDLLAKYNFRKWSKMKNKKLVVGQPNERQGRKEGMQVDQEG